MVLLLWCVCGGLLLHMLECNYFNILLKADFEKPVDTAEDVRAKGRILWYPGYELYKEKLIKQNISEVTRDLAEMTHVAKVSLHIFISKLCINS